MKYLRLIGYQDLLLIAGVQIAIKYFLFVPYQIEFALNSLGTFFLVLGSVSIAAAGKIILALNNIEADRINEKALIGSAISQKFAYNLFMGLNILGVGIGFYLANSIGHPEFSALAILVSGALYIYATYLKKQLIIGNLTIALLSTLAVISMGLFDLLPTITAENQTTQHTMFSILLDYSILTSLLVFIREILSDQLNLKGDHKAKHHTLPVAIGKNRTKTILFILGFIPLLSIAYYLYNYLFRNQLFIWYILLLVIGPLLYFLAKIISANTKTDYLKLRKALTFSLWFALLSLILFSYILS